LGAASAPVISPTRNHQSRERTIRRTAAEGNGTRTASVLALARSKEIRFRDFSMIERIFSNNLQAARYFFNSGWIFVTKRSDPEVIVTAERADHRKLGDDFFYLEDGEIQR
jgi:hypothetical protein